jgi:tetratricopeptide (TPR) repeat protein
MYQGTTLSRASSAFETGKKLAISLPRKGIPMISRITLAAVCLAAYAPAQDHDMDAGGMTSPTLPKSFSEPMPLYPKALGKFHRPISSANTEAQAYFDQGFQLMYAFGKQDATRSFREAEKRDPNCAICFWGEAWSWGSYLNGLMTTAEAPFAYTAAQKALALAPGHSTPEERDLIEAMTHRYIQRFNPNKRRDQDMAYAEEMRKLAAKYPTDLDVLTLYADSLFVMEPRRGWRDINSPNVQRIAAVLEGALKIDREHVGACHLYVHLTESTTVPGKAEACADSLGDKIPGASHLNHMPAHTYNQIGRWGDSVRANIEAYHSDLKAKTGEGFAIYPDHNLHMLLFAASMDGQGAIAMQAANDYFSLNGRNMMQILTRIRFGRFDQVLEITQRPKDEIEAGIYDFGHGYAGLRRGEVDFARAYLNRLHKAAETSKAVFRGHTAHDLLGVLDGILEGEFYRHDGDLDKAIQSFERSVQRYDAMDYDEPEPLPFAARHWLGAALLEAKRYSDAERVYREELKRHPMNGWSLYGLKAALEAQGKPSGDAAKQFVASWSRSDTWIEASRF